MPKARRVKSAASRAIARLVAPRATKTSCQKRSRRSSTCTRVGGTCRSGRTRSEPQPPANVGDEPVQKRRELGGIRDLLEFQDRARERAEGFVVDLEPIRDRQDESRWAMRRQQPEQPIQA